MLEPDRLAALLDGGVRVVSPESTYVDDSVVVEKGCILYPNVFLHGQTVIRRNSIIRHGCEVENSQIGEATDIESFSRVSASMISDYCKIESFSRLTESRLDHRCYIGPYSLVRRCLLGARVFIESHCVLSDATMEMESHLSSSVVTANYDGFKHHSTLIKARAHVGSAVILIAPVTVGEDAYIASGSVVKVDVPPGVLGFNPREEKFVEGWVSRQRTRWLSMLTGRESAAPRAEPSSKRPQDYRKRLEEFKALVAKNGTEEEYQRFLQREYWILGVGYVDCKAKVRAGAGYVPDFVLERHDGVFEVVEVKKPSTPLFSRSRGRLVESSELKQAISQLFDYLEYYKVHYLTESQIQGKDFRVVSGRLVIGRTVDPDQRKRVKQLNERYTGVTIFSYDNLLSFAASLVDLFERGERDVDA
jgi:acetyltransferase-like isoleucine patch superfamily enzyme